jgi:1-deoxy-D-xylulose-5-phosphate reductoisomerase
MQPKPLQITLLGATGSIGASTLDVIERHPDRYQVYALTANTNVDALEKLCTQWKPDFAVMNDENSASELLKRLQSKNIQTEILSGEAGLLQVVEDAAVNCVVAAIVGAAGLVPTLAAAKAGKRILLANKEALVMSGKLFMDIAKENNAVLMPVDSEHNAIFQCLPYNLTNYHSSVKITNQQVNSGVLSVFC